MRLKEAVIEAIEELRNSPPADLKEDGAYARIIKLLKITEEDNVGWPMGAKCGTSSGMLWEYLPSVLGQKGWNVKVHTAMAENKDTFGHVYNVITNLDEPDEEVLCDLSIAQFISSPMTIFNGKPYFVGSREELKKIVLSLQEKTLKHMQTNFPDLNIQSYGDIDQRKKDDKTFSNFYYKARDSYSENLVIMEKQQFGWDKTWGDESRCKFAASYSLLHLNQTI